MSRALFALLLAGTAISGCLQGDPGKDDDFVASCPSWIQGLSKTFVSDNFHPNDTTSFRKVDMKEADSNGPAQPLGGGFASFQGHALDQIVLDLRFQQRSNGTQAQILYVQDGRLELRFYRADDGQLVAAYDENRGPSSKKDVWVFEDEPGKEFGMYNVTMHVDLASSGESPRPTGVFVEWIFIRDADHDPETPSMASMWYTARFWYRTCNADGSPA